MFCDKLIKEGLALFFWVVLLGGKVEEIENNRIFILAHKPLVLRPKKKKNTQLL